MRRLSRRSSFMPEALAAKADLLSDSCEPNPSSSCSSCVRQRAIGGKAPTSWWPGACVSGRRMTALEKRIVYLLRSDADPSRHYVGITHDVAGRLEWHNYGPCGYTVANRPWSLVVALEFSSERDARRFEKYLKSGSGRAFVSRHFGPMATFQTPG